MATHASWLGDIFDPKRLNICARELSRQIRLDRKTMRIDCIAVRGVSGISMGAVVSAMTGIPLIIVRHTKGTHTDNLVEEPEFTTYSDEKHYVIIDEFICSGETIHRIQEDIKEETTLEYNLVKVYLYKGQKEDFSGCADPITVPVFSFHLEGPNNRISKTRVDKRWR
jgi:orotate phosphoribosyltransferase-like protein